jgi:hypothetical protein
MIRSIGGLTGGNRMLVGGVRGALSSGDSGLGSLVGILNIAMVGSGFGVKIIGLLDDRRGLGANVVFARATDRENDHEGTG